MQTGVLRIDNNPAAVINIMQADSVFERMRGLIGRKTLEKNQAFWISPCNAIHTFFMRYPIDVVFMNRQGEVRKVCAGVKPWSGAACWSASGVLELVQGTAAELGIRIGTRLRVDDETRLLEGNP